MHVHVLVCLHVCVCAWGRVCSAGPVKYDPRAGMFYRRPLPPNCIDFASPEGQRVFGEALAAGHMGCFFTLSAQFRTQVSVCACVHVCMCVCVCVKGRGAGLHLSRRHA